MNVASRRASVRWPFRLLASLIVLASMTAVVGTVVALWTHDASLLRWQFVAGLPGMAWLGRLGWFAAVRGEPPASAHWPFASERVLFWYFVAWTVACQV